jgi:uncharacterized protein YkwD
MPAGDAKANDTAGATRRRVTWWARLLVVPAAVGTVILASCASGGGAALGVDATIGGPATPAPSSVPDSAAGASAAPSPTSASPGRPTTGPRASRPRAVATARSRRPARATPSPTRSSRPSPRPSHAGSGAPAVRAPAPPATVAPPPSTGMTAAEAEVLRLVNVQRTSHGCGPLSSNPVLLRVARAHSADMASRGYFDHNSPDGRSPFDRMRAAGYKGGLMGENIAAGQPTPAAVMDAWMHSAGHRANILNCGYRVIGIGVASKTGSPYRIYWTQDFGDR